MIAFIPIKSTSQRIARKNFQDLGGKPLYQWTVEFALSVQNLDKVIICSDDLEHVENLCINDNRLELIGRPNWTLDPMTSNAQLIKWWVDAYASYNSDVCLLQPTHPFRRVEDFRVGFDSYQESQHLTMLVEPLDEFFIDVTEGSMMRACSRVLGDYYFFNPSKINLGQNFISQTSRFAEVPFSHMHLNIDTWDDLEFAREIFHRHLNHVT